MSLWAGILRMMCGRVRDVFRVLREANLALLRSLSAEEWDMFQQIDAIRRSYRNNTE
jgi:hypothetical protein